MERLLSVSEARQKLLEAFAPVEAVRVPLANAAGRVLAKDVFSPMDLPFFSNSTVDGFAVRSGDVKLAHPDRPVRLSVVGDIPAGQPIGIAIGQGQAARIMTGAPLPLDADGVIPVEDTNFNIRQQDLPTPEQVLIYRSIPAGGNIRPRGQDVHSGERVIFAGTKLRPQEVGFLAMIGRGEADVYRQPRVALLSTGDELIATGEPLQPGKIYDSNSFLLAALIESAGCEPVKLGIAADKSQAVEILLDRAVDERVDLILTSAGVSVGAFDFVRSVVETNGQLTFWRVNMRPGKPLAFGQYRHVPFIGLPGNPVSAFACFEVFVRSALLKLAGFNRWENYSQRVTLVDSIESDGRESYLRGVVTKENNRWRARLTGHQGSGNLYSLVQANALLIVPSGVKSLPAEAEVDAWILDPYLPG